MAMMVCGVSACSKDDEPGGGKKGNFSGWVEINGKKYKFNNAVGYWNENASYPEVGLSAFSKEWSKIKPGDVVNMANITIAFNPDGTWTPTESGEFPFDMEVYPDYKVESEEGLMYVNWDARAYDELTISRDGKKLYIDGKGYQFNYGEDGVSNSDPTTPLNFHFEGTITELSDDYFE